MELTSLDLTKLAMSDMQAFHLNEQRSRLLWYVTTPHPPESKHVIQRKGILCLTQNSEEFKTALLGNLDLHPHTSQTI